MKNALLLLIIFVAAVLAACSTAPVNQAQDKPIRIALIGDVPYSEHDRQISFPNMIAEINRADVAFVVHDGDIKSGSTPCSMEVLDDMYGQFQKFKAPFIYLFGDNEWTDCGRSPTNVLSPEQWLDKLRDRFCQGDQSLGQRTLKLERQSSQSRFEKFRENVRWTMGGVVFAGLNVPGDANNFGKAEYKARNDANLAWVRESFATAKTLDARAIMLILQANPHFELNSTNRLRAGFKDMMTLIEKETIAFQKPVFFVHGDSHYFRIDKPLVGRVSGRRIENFTRVETFGYPDVHWLEATIDPNEPEVFVFRQRIIKKNLVDQTKRPPG